MSMIAKSEIQSLVEDWAGQITSGSHQFMTDKSEKFGGQDTGPAPYDFLTASLASCTMITLRMYAKHKQFDWGEFQINVEFHMNREGDEWIERHLSFQKTLSEEQQQKILAICEKTPVTKTLLRSLKIHTAMVVDGLH